MGDLFNSIIDIDLVSKHIPFNINSLVHTFGSPIGFIIPELIEEDLFEKCDSKVDGKLIKAAYLLSLDGINPDMVAKINKFLSTFGYEFMCNMSSFEVYTFFNKEKNEYRILHKGPLSHEADLLKDMMSYGLYLLLRYNTPHVKTRAKITEKIVQHICESNSFMSTVSGNNNHSCLRIHLAGYSYGGYTISYAFTCLPEELRDKINSVTTINTLTNIFSPLGGSLDKDVSNDYNSKVTHKRIAGDILSLPLLYSNQNAKVVTYAKDLKQKAHSNFLTTFEIIRSLGYFLYSDECVKPTVKSGFNLSFYPNN